MTQTEWILCASHSMQNGSPIKPQLPLQNTLLIRSRKTQTALILQLIIPLLHTCWYYKHYQLSWSYLGHACITASTKWLRQATCSGESQWAKGCPDIRSRGESVEAYVKEKNWPWAF